jgi:16S rRNA G966 N2-methylase RsmD
VVTAVDIEQKCISFISSTAEKYGMEGLTTIRSNVFVFIKHPHRAYDLVFADPPYDMEGIRGLPKQVIGSSLLKEGGYFILEHSGRYQFDGDPGFVQVREYGKVNFSFFRKEKHVEEG